MSYTHEAMDRIHVIQSNIEDHLLDHPALYYNDRIRKKVEKATEELSKAYLALGNMDASKEDKRLKRCVEALKASQKLR